VSAVPNRLPPFDPGVTKGVCDVLAQTNWPGLTGPEIRQLLQMVRISSLEDGSNKREALYVTLHNTQVRQHAGNCLIAYIKRAMEPSRYVQQPDRYLSRWLRPVGVTRLVLPVVAG
jgi:hypothetical protein